MSATLTPTPGKKTGQREKDAHMDLRRRAGELNARLPGKYSREEYRELIEMILEWAHVPTGDLGEGRRGMVRAPIELAVVLDMLELLLVNQGPPYGEEG